MGFAYGYELNRLDDKGNMLYEKAVGERASGTKDDDVTYFFNKFD